MEEKNPKPTKKQKQKERCTVREFLTIITHGKNILFYCYEQSSLQLIS